MNTIVLRGFACPFDVTVEIGNGIYERIELHAFQDQCQYELDCSVKLDSHENSAPNIASTTDGTLLFFQTAFGLAFECTILPDIKNFNSVAWDIRSHKLDKASVHYSVRDADIDADGVEVVVAAQIDHIAITREAAFGNHTAVWNVNTPFDTSNDRLVVMAQRWQEGYAAYLSAKKDSSPEPGPSRRPVAISAEAVAAEQRLALQLRHYPNGNPHRGVPSAEPVPRDSKERGPIRTSLELHKAAFAEIDAGKSTMALLLESVDAITDRLIEAEQRLAMLEQSK